MFAPHIIVIKNIYIQQSLPFISKYVLGLNNLRILKPCLLRESDHVDEREKSPFHFGWMKRSKLLHMHVIDEGRGEFRTATGAGDECREVLHGVFGFGGALEDVEPTGERPCGSTCLFEGWW